jgi:hypothetical protein
LTGRIVNNEFVLPIEKILQYEMFFAGEPAAIQGRELRNFDWAAVQALVDRCLASYDITTL